MTSAYRQDVDCGQPGFWSQECSPPVKWRDQHQAREDLERSTETLVMPSGEGSMLHIFCSICAFPSLAVDRSQCIGERVAAKWKRCFGSKLARGRNPGLRSWVCVCVCVRPRQRGTCVWRQEALLDPVALEINSAAINNSDRAGEIQPRRRGWFWVDPAAAIPWLDDLR